MPAQNCMPRGRAHAAVATSTKSRLCRDDVYELAYCYDNRAVSQDVYKRSIEPYAKRLLEGCNVNAVIMGSTESGKDLLLRGSERDSRGAASPGILQHFLQHLFKELHTSSIQVRS